MKIFYRATSVLSSNPNPLGKNKDIILDVCLKSFIKAGGKNITFVIDRMSDDWIKRLSKIGDIIYSEPGLESSLRLVYDEVIKLPNDEKVLLCEDDYLWQPDSVEMIKWSLDEFELISPYDHPGHYIEDRFKHQPKQMRMFFNQTFRQAPSNTHTFACKAYVIKQNYNKFYSLGMRDHELFSTLGIDMFVPVPSWATHLVCGLIAPNVKWGI